MEGQGHGKLEGIGGCMMDIQLMAAAALVSLSLSGPTYLQSPLVHPH